MSRDTDDTRSGVLERLGSVVETASSHVWFTAHTYPRSLRRYSIGITRPTLSYLRWVGRQKRRWAQGHGELAELLRRWPCVWGTTAPDPEVLRHSGHRMRVHAWDDVVRPSPGQTNDDLARAFLPGLLTRLVAPGDSMIVCTSSGSAADGTRPKPLREFAFLDQVYWGSTANVGDLGECWMTHLFVSMVTSGSQEMHRLTRIVVDTDPGVFVMPADLRWVAVLYEAGVDFSTVDAECLERLETAAIAAGGRPLGADSWATGR